MSTKVFTISEILSPDLALRDSAARLFKEFGSTRDAKIVVDFTGVRSITRSFAHEYCKRKTESASDISETHVPVNVRKMMAAASRLSSTRSRSLDLDSAPVILL